MKVKTEFPNVWGEYKNQHSPFTQSRFQPSLLGMFNYTWEENIENGNVFCSRIIKMYATGRTGYHCITRYGSTLYIGIAIVLYTMSYNKCFVSVR